MDAHAREYAGAVAGMQECSGWHDTGNTLPAVGDLVSVLIHGQRWSGHVQTIEGSRMVVGINGLPVLAFVEEITH